MRAGVRAWVWVCAANPALEDIKSDVHGNNLSMYGTRYSNSVGIVLIYCYDILL